MWWIVLTKPFKHFFADAKGEKSPAFHDFESMHRYNSFCYPQSGFSLIGKELKLSKIGESPPQKCIALLKEKLKRARCEENATGAWDVSFSCEVNVDPLSLKQESIGIDVGLEHFATLSNGREIANPRFFKHGEKALAKKSTTQTCQVE